MKILVKSIILVVIMGLASDRLMAQKQKYQVPQPVQNAFSSKYPHALLKNWKTVKDKYLASFTMNNREYVASYSNGGEWLSTVTELPLSELPPELLVSLRKSNYASYHINDAEYVQTPLNDQYLLKVDNNSGNKPVFENVGSVRNELLYFSHEGILVNAVAGD